MASHSLRVLSLCSGYGGLDLAVRLVFPGARTLCYVEREISAVRVLAARMAEGSLDSAPVWDDVATFDPVPWVGCVDLLVAGFPCQPHSVAGKREGLNDHRWPVWDDIIRIAKGCAARSIFLENVPGLLTSSKGASIAKVRADLEHAGFTNQSACVLGARDVGASHKRDRLFILAHAESVRDAWWSKAQAERQGTVGRSATVAHADSQRQSQRRRNEFDIRRWAGDQSEAVGDTNGIRWRAGGPKGCCSHHADPPVPRLSVPGPDDNDGWIKTLVGELRFDLAPRSFRPHELADLAEMALAVGWQESAVESAIRRMADDVATGMDVSRANRLRMLGNGVVPLQAAAALKHLMENIQWQP